MKRILTFTLLLLALFGFLLCKSNEDKTGRNGLLLFGILLTQNASAACNPTSGFTICIPKGIAE